MTLNWRLTGHSAEFSRISSSCSKKGLGPKTPDPNDERLANSQFLLARPVSRRLRNGASTSFPHQSESSMQAPSFVPPPSPFEMFMNYQGPFGFVLLHRRFLTVLKLLVRHRALKSSTGEQLAKHDWFEVCLDEYFLPNVCFWNRSPGADSTPEEINAVDRATLDNAWNDFLSTVLESPSHHQDLNELLYSYITTKRALALAGRKIDLARVTVSRLIQAGADINYRPALGGPTALHVLCSSYVDRPVHQTYGSIYADWDRPQEGHFIRFLVGGCHADPTLEWEGKTPISIASDRLNDTTDMWHPDDKIRIKKYGSAKGYDAAAAQSRYKERYWARYAYKNREVDSDFGEELEK
ncbi:hypothetical protein B0H66DRAFT_536296 [Apodospora peruviana]|uniref:Ankyrin repeat protein n=1 Tax=Apodospora peruviana TaxID=516989 RepID=A0AAE0I0N1_9PEZI|nr:hypothetical protein B0H66DRAFT_536296 [Apodospora peruviana]